VGLTGLPSTPRRGARGPLTYHVLHRKKQMPNAGQQHIIDEYRARNGALTGPFEGSRMLLLTTVGARTGERHTTPLGYLPNGMDGVIVIASAGGSPRHPDWYRNLLANPRVTVENSGFVYEAEAVVLTGEERDPVFARAVESDAAWADYQARAGRTLPVVVLREIPGPPNMPGVTGFGQGLRRIHDSMRRELSLIRAELAASGPGLGAQMRINCLTFCAALTVHHQHEDAGLLPQAAERFPELAPVVTRLSREHERVSALLTEIQRVISDDSGDRDTMLRDMDRLSAELEEHLRYEEEQLIPLFDAPR
jgi:deazaflavin-dependent oxidoreductase (nitroreductase family)